MSTYKEVFVKSETIKEICTKFLEELELLREKADAKYDLDLAAYKSWVESEEQRAKEYRKYHPNSGRYFMRSDGYFFRPYHPFHGYESVAKSLLKATECSEEAVLTQGQNEQLLFFRDRSIQSIKSDLAHPWTVPRPEIEDWELKPSGPKQIPVALATRIDSKHSRGSFFNALVCIGGLTILVCILIKACGG